jgi:6-phosphogluconolactonase (cycloisomerase 2 family)
MELKVFRVLAATFAFTAPFALAQSSNPVAYIYVSSVYGGSNKVVGYAASADGKLTEIAGSPWADNLSYLATNGSYLFGSTNIASDNGRNIFSYKIESDGALKYIGANNIQDAGSENACNQAGSLLLDHTGSYLYVFVKNADCKSEAAYQSFAVNKSTGLLDYLGVTKPNAMTLGSPLTMLADDDYAYASGYGADDTEICGFKKAASGNLVDLDTQNGSPVCTTAWPGTEGQPSGTSVQVNFIAADPTNHLAADMEYLYTASGGYLGDKIATFSVSTANGSQSTSSTYANMPDTDTPAPPVTAVAMAPGGKLLAVSSTDGIQIFNFNPNGQATANTGLITTSPINAMYWDTSNHLYAISTGDSALHVFTVTAAGAFEAPGSPYFINLPVAITGHSFTAASTLPNAQYEASFSPTSNATTGSGTISMDTTGQITLELSGAPAEASYTVAFCPAFWFYSQQAPCFDVGTVSTDSSGSANESMKFPKSGEWAGDFELNSGSTEMYLTTYTPDYLAALEPESTLNGGELNQSGEAQLPLTSGNVTYSGDSFLFTLTGTSPGTTFDAIENQDELQGPDSNYLQYDFSATNGDASFSEPPSGAGGDVLELEQTFYVDVSGQGFIGGFSVP